MMTKKERDKKLTEIGEKLAALMPDYGYIQFNFKGGKLLYFNLMETGKPEKKE